MIESFPINPDYGALGYKGGRINIINDTENRSGLPFFSEHEHHLLFLPRISPGSIDHRNPSMQRINLLTNLLILLRDDKELHGLAGTVHDLIQHETTNI